MNELKSRLEARLAITPGAELKALELEGRAMCTCCVFSKRGEPCPDTCSVTCVYTLIKAEIERRQTA